MTPGQSWQLHVNTYRTEAQVANRETIVVPKHGTYAGFTEVNQQAVLLNKLLNRPQAVVDVQALAAALDELVDTGATEEEIRALLNSTKFQVVTPE